MFCGGLADACRAAVLVVLVVYELRHLCHIAVLQKFVAQFRHGVFHVAERHLALVGGVDDAAVFVYMQTEKTAAEAVGLECKERAARVPVS